MDYGRRRPEVEALEAETGLHDRAADNWRPLLALSDALGGAWPTRARAAARSLAGIDQEETLGVQLLSDINEIFSDEDVMSSSAIITALVALDDRPWATWSRQDKPLTIHGLARLLRHFESHSSGTQARARGAPPGPTKPPLSRGGRHGTGVTVAGKAVDVTDYSDALLMFILKAERPEKYRDRREVKHSGDVNEWAEICKRSRALSESTS